MKKSKIHYAGAVKTPRMRILGGWSACCYGDKAERIRAEGRNTYDIGEVTCAACRRMMAKDERVAAVMMSVIGFRENSGGQCHE